jgi:hypothetical protein
MKKYLLILVSFLLAQSFFGQIVFCPTGAKWHFLNKSGAESYPFERYEAVEYTRDSLLSGITAKVLNHTLFYTGNSEACRVTLIKQVGDTVFLRNKFTQHTWQVLYNFNATSGQSWQNALQLAAFPGTAVYNFTTTVDSVTILTSNSTIFKRMYVSIKNSGNTISEVNSVFTERYGANRFLFYWSLPNPFIDINNFTQILCYEDQNWPLQQFSNKPCNYSNSLAIEQSKNELENIKVFPNPVVNVLTIEWENVSSFETLEFKVYNCLGEQIKHCWIKNSETVLLEHLSPGLYFIELFSNKKRVHATKVIKE